MLQIEFDSGLVADSPFYFLQVGARVVYFLIHEGYIKEIFDILAFCSKSCFDDSWFKKPFIFNALIPKDCVGEVMVKAILFKLNFLSLSYATFVKLKTKNIHQNLSCVKAVFPKHTLKNSCKSLVSSVLFK